MTINTFDRRISKSDDSQLDRDARGLRPCRDTREPFGDTNATVPVTSWTPGPQPLKQEAEQSGKINTPRKHPNPSDINAIKKAHAVQYLSSCLPVNRAAKTWIHELLADICWVAVQRRNYLRPLPSLCNELHEATCIRLIEIVEGGLSTVAVPCSASKVHWNANASNLCLSRTPTCSTSLPN